MQNQFLTLLGTSIVAAMAATCPAAIINLTDAIGDPVSNTSVTPGGSFQVQTSLTLGAGENAFGITFQLGASQSNIFTITARTVEPGNPFTAFTTPNPAAPAAFPGLNPNNGSDLGCYMADLSAQPAGTYALYTFTIAVAPTATGTYQINVIGADYSDAAFDTFPVNPTSYSVTVPEPVVLGMLGTASGGLLIRRRAKAK